jgi:hypothetical protein
MKPRGHTSGPAKNGRKPFVPKKRPDMDTLDMFGRPPDPDLERLKKARADVARARGLERDPISSNPRQLLVDFLNSHELRKLIETAELRGRWDEKINAGIIKGRIHRLKHLIGE